MPSQYVSHGELDTIVDVPVTLMFAEAVLLVSASAVAATVAVKLVAVTAAVNSPALNVPAEVGATDHVAAVLVDPVTVASNWIIPPAPTVIGSRGDVMEIETDWVTVSVAPVKLHPVASLEAVHPEPLIVALPAPTPVSVSPEIVTTPEGLTEKLPPVHPEGAEAVLVPPTTMAVGLTVTAPVGQLGGGGVGFPPPLPPQEEMNPAGAQNNKINISFVTETPLAGDLSYGWAPYSSFSLICPDQIERDRNPSVSVSS